MNNNIMRVMIVIIILVMRIIIIKLINNNNNDSTNDNDNDGDDFQNGGWCLLQNCHLGLDYMIELMDTLLDADHIDSSFRIWITTEMHPQFPITLLQMSIKFTNEPPLGIKAGLKRTYTGENKQYLMTKLFNLSGCVRCWW